MVKKSKIDFVFELEKNSNSGKSDFAPAHQLSKSKLKKNTKNKHLSKPTFSDVKTGHRTPDTEHLKKENGPEGNRTPDLYHFDSFLVQLFRQPEKGAVKVTSYHYRIFGATFTKECLDYEPITSFNNIIRKL